jgi:hypothetical protein
LDPSSVVPTTADFQCRFDDITNIRNEILFVTGDRSIWAKANYEDIARGGEQGSANPEFETCVCGTESLVTGSFFDRGRSAPEDPWISIADGDYHDGSRAGLMMWGENGSSTSHAFLRVNHGGVNVYIRPLV